MWFVLGFENISTCGYTQNTFFFCSLCNLIGFTSPPINLPYKLLRSRARGRNPKEVTSFKLFFYLIVFLFKWFSFIYVLSFQLIWDLRFHYEYIYIHTHSFFFFLEWICLQFSCVVSVISFHFSSMLFLLCCFWHISKWYQHECIFVFVILVCFSNVRQFTDFFFMPKRISYLHWT